MLWQICFVLLAIYALVLCWKFRKLNEIHEQLPINLKSVPILRHAVHLLGDGQDRMNGIKIVGRTTIENHDGLSSVWLGLKLLVVVADPLAAEVVMKACLEKDDMMEVARYLIGNGSIFAPVSIWRPRRKFISPNFGLKTLNSFVEIFSKQATILTQQLEKAAGKGNFNLFDTITKYSMDSVCETALGVEVRSQNVPNHPVPKAFNRFCDLAAARILKPWLYPLAIYRWHWDFSDFDRSTDVVQQFVAKIVKSKKNDISQKNNNLPNQELQPSENKKAKIKSMLELLIEAGGDQGFTDLELQEETLVMLLAGTDTSSVAASFTALLLAQHPDIQEKVYQEVIEVIGDTDKHIESKDLPKLKYLEAVVKETLRLYPPVPVYVRKVVNPVTLPTGVTLVPGMGVIIHAHAMHRNKKYWGPDAYKFRPERFLEGPLKHPYAYLPFSNGPRNCLGGQYAMMSIKTVMAHLLRRYRFIPRQAPGHDSDEKDGLETTFEIMMKHVHNFEIRFEIRNHNKTLDSENKT